MNASPTTATAAAPPAETRPDLLTVAEAAANINTSERFARRLVSDRHVQVVKLGKHVRIPRPALDEYVAANTREPVVPRV
ncbi:excisionase family DNA-binding protein [Microbacterium sp. SSW1-59]|uniref:excisionase family DNA-binding protein n=1 Tax=Microbacterium xanthum TaxID=3079794 RepID=UPI002AD28178|nr:excisionase family DNA-binding protein [Microbacterium sp. SSW1-59]MDZ8201867.1 excisionase family DNA-binding protein [Microbacterium sp. SSW1-59]